jgi:hypothetical protein
VCGQVATKARVFGQTLKSTKSRLIYDITPCKLPKTRNNYAMAQPIPIPLNDANMLRIIRDLAQAIGNAPCATIMLAI